MICCTTHPTAVAGWHCSRCSLELCVECAALTENRVVVCASCGTLVTYHQVPRAEVYPFRSAWPSVLRELASPRIVLQNFVVSAAAHFCFTYGKALWIIGWVGAAAWVLNLARRAALGLDSFSPPGWEDLRIVVTGPLPRFVCATAALGLAAMGWTRLGLVARPLDSPWPWIFGLAAVIAVPPALAIASVEGTGALIPWPWRMGRLLRQLGADLRPLQVAVLIVVALELFESQLPPINREFEDLQMREHLFESWVPRLVSFAALGALGGFAGVLVFTRAGELGHRSIEDDLVARVTAPPTGHCLPPVRDVDADERERARKFEAIELEEGLETSAIDRGARDEAIAGYRSGAILASKLQPAAAVTLAQWLAGAGDFLAAANLLRVLTANLSEPRAMIVLARLCSERLGAPVEAIRLYEAVARQFPGTSAARFAVEQLIAHRANSGSP